MRIGCTSELNVKVVFSNTSTSEITMPTTTTVRAFTNFYKMNMNVLRSCSKAKATGFKFNVQGLSTPVRIPSPKMKNDKK